MKLYIIAGEASGDLHGSNLIKALQQLHPGVQCRVWGGDLMQSAGGILVKHYRELAFMGFWEVAKNIRTIFSNLRYCQQDILRYQPDTLVLIDYPGFNLRIARWAKKRNIRVVYYISPQIWAWHSSRVHAIKRDVDKMLVILPFETEFYRKYGVDAEFVGHPLRDVITVDGVRSTVDGGRSTVDGRRSTVDGGRWTVDDKRWTMNDSNGAEGAISKPSTVYRLPSTVYRPPSTVTLLPGSRVQEVRRILPVMLSVTPYFPEYKFVVAGAQSLPPEFFQTFLGDYPGVQLEYGKTYELLAGSAAALVKSGTSTLETALMGTPQVVCYAGSPVSFAIARRVVNVRYISLVNLILDRPLVRELIQDELNTAQLREALADILNPDRAAGIRAGYAELRHKLGDGGASLRAARAILNDLA